MVEAKDDPMPEGNWGKTWKTTGRVGGLETALLVKALRPERDPRMGLEFFDNEARFLEEATRKGLITVPRLYDYTNRGTPTITMQFIQGKQYISKFDILEGPLELQLTTLPLYVLTMAGIVQHTGKVKVTDNKALNIIFTRQPAQELGDLVIIDWSNVERATPDNIVRFLAESINQLARKPVDEYNRDAPILSIEEYFREKPFVQREEAEAKAQGRPLTYSLILRRQFRDEALEKISKWLEKAPQPDTPYATIVRRLMDGIYARRMEQLVVDLVAHYRWQDTLSNTNDPQREALYRQILSWATPEWIGKGIDMQAAVPWIAHLNERKQPEETARPERGEATREQVPKGYIPIQDAASQIGRSPGTIYRLYPKSIIHVGNEWYVKREDLTNK